MDTPDVTFVFEDKRAFALQEGQVIASANTIEELESEMVEREKRAAREHDKTATHITTPSGLTGEILGRVKDVWGDTVTVRFANNNIASIPVNEQLTFHNEETPEGQDHVQRLHARVAGEIKGTMSERKLYLEGLLREAHDLIGTGLSDLALTSTHTVVADITGEIEDITNAQAFDLAQEAESFIPTSPFEPSVVEQADLGGNDSSWLNDTHADMVAEADNTDFDVLLSEGPESFAAGLETATLADSGVVRQMASSLVADKTHLAEPELREKYATAFLERVEHCRRQELRIRQSSITKEAQKIAEDVTNVPDDALFS